MTRNAYSGWRVPMTSGDPLGIDEISADTLDPKRFWNDYVSKRKPVLMNGQLPDKGWLASKKWTDEYLIKEAGASQLLVEVRKALDEGYGKGVKQAMTFKEFLTRLHQGDENVYLTTQKVPCAADGHPSLYGEPLKHLSKDFVLQPSVTGNLIPQQLNFWMGCARSGSSSGLHHDFHDNLYVLLRGRKRFRLWDPSHAMHMHTQGKATLVHPNGRVVYAGQEDVLADGSSAREVAAWEARRAAEGRVRDAEEALKRGERGAAGQLAKAEEGLERLMEEQLESALGTGGGEDAFDNLQDDYVDEDMDSDDDDDEELDEEEEEEEQEGDAFRPGKRGRRGLGASASKKRAKVNKGKKGAKGKGSKVTAPEPDPPSFCTGVDLSMPDAELKKRFPGFPGKEWMMEVWVEQGQMLYLPAGWFHEVTSFSDGDAKPQLNTTTPGGSTVTRSRKRAAEAKTSSDSVSAPASHAAFNYWFHPPDGHSYDRPYERDYWPSLWQQRCTTLGVAPPVIGVESTEPPRPALVRHLEFDGVRVDEKDGATGHDPHRGPRHSFDGVKVDEKDGATGHDPHRGPRHSFDGVKVDEKEGATGHDPHRGPRHSFDGVKVDEKEGATGHDPHRGPHHHFEGVKVDEAAGATGHDPHRGPHHHFDGVKVDEKAGGTGHDPHAHGHPTQHAGVVTHASGNTAAPVASAAEVSAAVQGKRGRKAAAPKRLGPASHAAAASVDAQSTAPAEEPAVAAGGGGGGGSTHGKDAQSGTGKAGAVGGADKLSGKGAAEAKAVVDGEKKQKGKKRQAEAPQEEERLLEGDEGELGEMVAKEMGEYFQSEEGSGAFKRALREYLLKALAEGGFHEDGEGQEQGKGFRRKKGRRHHRVVRVEQEGP